MSTPPSGPRASTADADAAPAGALSDVWVLLDELPRGTASPVLTATTIEMAAVAADAGRPRAAAWRRLLPAATVVAALALGAVAGRVTAPDPERRLLDNLPVVRHLDLLSEAGSVKFLEDVAGRGGPPLRMLLRQGPDAARQETAEFTARLDALGKLLAADAAARREFVAGLHVEERAELERSLRDFSALSGAERKTLAAVAEALVDPARPELRSAAADWHRWLAVASRPEDRDDIIASATDKRLDWIDWYASRVDGRVRPGPPERPPQGGRWPPGGEPPRGGEGRFRRPQPPRGEGESRDGPPPREGPPRERHDREGPPRDGPPRPRPDRESEPRPPVRPDAPAPPPETPAPPG